MLRYKCLILDHDDTVVLSEAALNYPAFLAALDILRPGEWISPEDFTRWSFDPGFLGLCIEKYHFIPEEIDREYHIWQDYVKDKMAPLCAGMDRVIARQREEGGIVCVVSHSAFGTIARDYQHYFGFVPEDIYSWDLPLEQRKPSPYPLEQIMRKYDLSPKDLLVVDDLKPGFDMAASVGADCAFAAWGRKNVPEIAEYMASCADFVFNSPEELEKFLF